MIYIAICHNKCSAIFQYFPNFVELLALRITHIFKKTRGNNYVEVLVPKTNFTFKQILFKKIWCRILDGDINPKVVYIRMKQPG